MAEAAARTLTPPVHGGVAWRVLLLACLLLFAASAALGQSKRKDPRWADLAPAEQQILQPLAAEWDRLEPSSRASWLGVAKRYPKMTPIGQKRTQTRMKKWAKLSPQQRQEVRNRYKRLKQEPSDLSSAWERYQSLPPGERQSFTAPPSPTPRREPSKTRQRAKPAAPAPAK